MKVSLNHIRFYQKRYNWSDDPAPEGIEKLVEKMGAQLGAIEEVVDIGKRYGGALIVKVLSCRDHPNADRLHVCTIDDGGRAQNVERGENGHVQVVCGAPNVHKGMLAVWLPPGSTVPSTVNKDPFVLEARELRGVKSNGMMASPKELGLGDNHEGILEIDDEDVRPGTPFAEHYHLAGDYLLDIENKMFTHRPDCFGMMGVAREIAGIHHQPFRSPEWYVTSPEMPGVEAEELRLEVQNEIPELVPRFTAVTMRDVAIRQSPVWMQIELSRLGLRPINNVVDITNYYMLLTGQPLHTYDYDKVMAQDANADRATLVVRYPRSGEKIRLLNGKEIEPRSEAIMIATRDRLIGVGGVMGGGDTEVDEYTKNIILECASFDMYSIRRTSMTHGLFTDAVTRFTKGQSPLQNLAVLAKAMGAVKKLAGGQVAGNVIDDNHLGDRQWVHPPVSVSAGFINARLGLELSAEDMKQLLENVECRVAVEGEKLTVTAPFWRTDIETREDVMEEVGRLYGFDKLPLELPRRSIAPTRKDEMLELKAKVRDVLSRAGANELLTYSFVHSNLLDKVGQSREHAFQLSNAISPDLQYYRISLTPSLLEKVHPNIKAGYDEFALFELGSIHCIGVNDPQDQNLPQEDLHLSLVFASNEKTAARHGGAPYYIAKRYLHALLPEDAVQWVPLHAFDFGDDTWGRQMCTPYEPDRSAVLVKDGLAWGVAGEFCASACQRLKLPGYCSGFELAVDLIRATTGAPYQPLPRFPKVEQDICLKVPAGTSYRTVYDFVHHRLEATRPDQATVQLIPVDIYQRQDDPEHKQITLRLSIVSYQRTLTDEEVGKLLNEVADTAKTELGAERI